MRTTRTHFKSALLAAGLFAFGGGAVMEVKGQDPLWVVGNQTLQFPGATGGGIRLGGLPTSFDDDIPDEYEYQGHVATRTQNIQLDGEGKLAFFVIDGNIYNRDGLLIVDDAANLDDTDCEVCFVGGEEVHIFPVPGSCTRYFIVSLLFNSYEREVADLDPGMIEWGILDMAEPSTLLVYVGLCAPVNGRMLSNADAHPYTLIADDSPTNVVPAINSNGTFSFQYASIYTDNGDNQAINGASVQVGSSGRTLLAVRCNQAIVMLQVHANGITQLPGAWPTGSFDNNISQRGELAVKLNGTQLRVAYSSYLSYFLPAANCVIDNEPVPIHNTQIGFAQFDLTMGALIGVTMPTNTPAPNPRNYSLDLYCTGAPYPVDGFGNDILRPAVSGLEFSPNGRYIYFAKSTDLAFPNSGGPQTTFGCVDLNWLVGDPGDPRIYLPIDEPTGTRRLCETQLDINTAPDGIGQALYMLGADAVGEYWLGAFVDPNNPDIATCAINWQTNVVDLGSVAFRNEYTSPATQHRFLDRRIRGATDPSESELTACCPDLVLSRDRSTTIRPDCDLTWEPGDNAFWDTKEPIFIDTELRIQAGAHVVAKDMIFKFGEFAKLVIEPTASLKCTNCVFTNACDLKRWNGIEVQGLTTQHQFGQGNPTYQGKLDLQACIVEQAYIGILTGSPASFKTTSGAVINCAGATVLENIDADPELEQVYKRTIIRNCAEGVKFYPYQNWLPSSGTPANNLSRFDDVLFTVDVGYSPWYDFKQHAWLNKVSGIPFTACTFENKNIDSFFGILGSAGLGHGIYSLDANYRVQSRCDQPWPAGGPPCPEAQTQRSEFIGLDHGIHALQATTLRNFSVDRAQFTNNICGVYSNGVVNYKVVNSKFSVGGRNVALVGDEDESFIYRHRGIFSTESYGMIVEDNEVDLDPAAEVGRLAEGIVIGFSRDHNDVVFRNTVRNMERGYIGEGICMDESNRTTLGLQFWCNKNTSNQVNIRSRILTQANGEYESIRLQQGTHNRVADNEFDQDAAGYDFYNDGFNYNLIGYYWAEPQVPYWPEYISQGVAREGYNPNGTPHVRWQANCASRRLPLIDFPNVVHRNALYGLIESEKLAYATTRYLYDDLIDGGNTDQVLDEIMESWPQDAWELRAYLMSKSPYLTVEVLKEMAEKPGFPEAMKAEVCVANPDATKTEGFLKWLELDCVLPVSETTLENIRASWDNKTYRTILEENMAHHHAEMSQAANLLLEYFALDTENDPTQDLRGVWQEVRTAAGRYAEALSLMQEGDYPSAQASVAAVIIDNPRLRPGQVAEKERVVDLITFMQAIADDNRDESELTAGEQDQLEVLIAEAYDRPATWAQNLLCFHYGRCRAPLTGGEDEAPKSLHVQRSANPANASPLTVAPNPANAWAACTYRLGSAADRAMLVVKDALGRQVDMKQLGASEGQVVIDTRTFGKGLYTIELINGGLTLQVEKLMVE